MNCFNRHLLKRLRFVLDSNFYLLLIALCLHVATPVVAAQTAATTALTDESSTTAKVAQAEAPQADKIARANSEKPSKGFTASISIGFGKQWKLGYSTPLRVSCTANESQKGSLAVQTVDGDGVPVTYRYPEVLELAAGQTREVELLIRCGRADSLLKIIWTPVVQSDTKLTAIESVFNISQLGNMLPASQPWVVEIGDLKLSVANYVSLSGQLPPYSVCTINQANELPDFAAGYEGVDLIAVSTKDVNLLRNLPVNKQTALLDHVRGGGRLLISLGRQAPEIQKIDWFSKLLPGRVDSIQENINAASIESLIGASKRLDGLSMPLLKLEQGTVDLLITMPNRQVLPVIIRSHAGLGQVLTFTADLNDAPVAKWEDRPFLVQHLLKGQWVNVDEQLQSVSRGSSSYLGYDDLSGQLRATLDTFPQVSSISFSFLALLLVGILLLLGPAEYYFWIRGLRRPGWTWPTMALLVSLFSAGIVYCYQQWRPDGPFLRSVELIDIDSSSGFQRGRLWFHTYSTPPSLLSFKTNTSLLGKSETVIGMSDWQPLTGKGIGGLDSGIRSLESLPGYSIHLPKSSQEKAPASSETITTKDLENVPFAAGGTKSFRMRWSGNGESMQIGKLEEVPGSGLLNGQLQNPLDVDLLDAYLVYHQWVYALPTRLRPGESQKFDILSKPKDFARRLTRRIAIDGKDRTAAWNPAERNSLPDVMEMMMFYEAAGGEKYTGLQHRFESAVDFSDTLNLDVAILVARLPSSKTRIEIDRNRQTVPVENQISSFVRWLIPVNKPQ
jgi:hypothetical protein